MARMLMAEDGGDSEDFAYRGAGRRGLLSSQTPQKSIGPLQPFSPGAPPTVTTEARAMPSLADQLRAQWGGDWNISGIDRAQELAGILQGKGVTTLSGLKIGSGRKYEDPAYGGNFESQWRNGNTPSKAELIAGGYSNRDTDNGKFLDFGNGLTIGNFSAPARDMFGSGANNPGDTEFGWSAAGKGAVGYHAVSGPNGQVQISPQWASSSEAPFWRGYATTALSALAAVAGGPALLGVTGAGAGAAAAGAGAFEGIGGAMATGGAPMTAAEFAAAGAAGGGTAAGAGTAGLAGLGELGINTALSPSFFTMPSATTIGKSALINGAISKAQGGDFFKGAAIGALTGGLSGFTPAAGLGITNPVLGGAVNGAARGAITATASGGDISNGLINAAIAGGVGGFNPAAKIGITDPDAARAINRAVAGMATGASPKAAITGAAVGYAGQQLDRTAGTMWDGVTGFSPSAGQPVFEPGIFEPGGAGYEPATQAQAYDPGPIDGYDYDGSAAQPAPTQNTEAPTMPINGYDYDGDPTPPSPINGYDYDGSNPPDLPMNGYDAAGNARDTPYEPPGNGSGWFDRILKSLVGGGKVNSGPGGGGSIFDLGPLSGIIGHGVNAAFISKEGDKGRAFLKSQTDAGWAREERLLAEKHARMAPIRKAGLLSSAITTSRTGP